MEPAKVWRSTVAACVLTLSVTYPLINSCPLWAQGAKEKVATADRPGDAPYAPTKLEWAALELQASYGSTTWTSESPVIINYIALSDGATVDCVLQYTPDVSAEVVKTNRDVAQVVFNKYAASRGWSWLRLRFEERILRPSH
jgi:hypothetical protein